MLNPIEKSFFFFHSKIEMINTIVKLDKKQFVLAPLLPAISLTLAINQLIEGYWVNSYMVFFISVILITSLFFTYMLSVASVYFLQNKNIFEKYKLHTESIQNQSEKLLLIPPLGYFRSKNKIKRSTTKEIHNAEIIFLPEKKNLDSQLTLFLKRNNKKNEFIKNDKKTTSKQESLNEEVVFTDKQSKLVKSVFEILKSNSLGTRIFDYNNDLESFIRAIKTLELEESKRINLVLQTKHCHVFLVSFFIPLVDFFTGNELNKKQAVKLFNFKIKDGFRSLKEESISRKERQESTAEQREKYKKILESCKMSVEQKN